jgi:hypothetical protein
VQNRDPHGIIEQDADVSPHRDVMGHERSPKAEDSVCEANADMETQSG